MGNQAQVKDIRKQIRNVAIELLPQITGAEAFQQLQVEMHKRLDAVTEEVRATLLSMQERQKDVQNYLMREISAGQAVTAPPSAEPTKVE